MDVPLPRAGLHVLGSAVVVGARLCPVPETFEVARHSQEEAAGDGPGPGAGTSAVASRSGAPEEVACSALRSEGGDDRRDHLVRCSSRSASAPTTTMATTTAAMPTTCRARHELVGTSCSPRAAAVPSGAAAGSRQSAVRRGAQSCQGHATHAMRPPARARRGRRARRASEQQRGSHPRRPASPSPQPTTLQDAPDAGEGARSCGALEVAAGRLGWRLRCASRDRASSRARGAPRHRHM